MAAKEYKARSIQEAVRQIRAEIGPNAMILSTRRIPKNVRDPYGKDMFEVVALAPNDVSCEMRSKDEFVEKDVETAYNSNHSNLEKKQSDIDLTVIRDEIVSIRDMLTLIDKPQNLPDFLQTHPEGLNVYARLVNSGISEKNAQVLVKKGYDAAKDKSIHSGALTKNILKEIVDTISVEDPFKLKKKRRIIAAFIGPTGVGKTTTIAKLAANLCLKEKKSVGLISIDGYRIGALEQLKTYAAIMGIACLSAFTRDDLKVAVNRLKNKDIILIDTAGQNHMDDQRMRELTDVVGGHISISNHLVLSAATKTQDIRSATDRFMALKPQTYVFTKVDETKIRGGLLDQLMNVSLPVSFLTNGQNVPDDILAATKKNVSQTVLAR